MLLDDMGLSWAEKRSVMQQARASYAHGFPADPHQLGTRFRKEKVSLEKLLGLDPDGADPLAPGLRVLRRRSEQLAPLAAELRAAISEQRVALPLPVLCGSFIHLHSNRLLRSAHHAQEFVIYCMLDRLYDSMQARKKPIG
jgi:thiopeptide-type bacteriocin biosynthesis protein